MQAIAGVIAGFFLAYANGANDNFKGVATLYGGGTTSFRRALAWASVTTAAGCFAAIFLGQGLVAKFSGKGLVPDAVIGSSGFALSVALAAAGTVMLATRLGFPVSTTHALMGALAGAGLVASEAGLNAGKLMSGFLVPLLVGPLAAIAAASALYPAFRAIRRTLRMERKHCQPAGIQPASELRVAMAGARAGAGRERGAMALPLPAIAERAGCTECYAGRAAGIDTGAALDALHYLSAGVVSFARGLNDAPKIAALLLAGASLPGPLAAILVMAAMALGGWLSAGRVAETMANRVTAMNPGQGFTANLVTGALVTSASVLGLPMSTTHVSCGALFGIGAVSRRARWNTIAKILAAWVTTLPLATLLGAGICLVLKALVPR